MINLQKQYVKIVQEFIKPFKKDINIIGITLNGGISRGTGDIYSEIDITFFVKNKKHSKLPPDKDDINVNGVWFDFCVKEISNEINRNWKMDERWDAKHAKILFERNHLITKLLNKKTFLSKKDKKKLIDEIAFKAYWCISLAEIFEKRNSLKNAHILINEALSAFIDYYFISDNELIPHYKWKHYYFSRLKKPGKKIKDIIFDLFLIRDYTKKELLRRIGVIKKSIIKEDLKGKYYPYHKQDINSVNKFIASLKDGIRYEYPFKHDKKEMI